MKPKIGAFLAALAVGAPFVAFAQVAPQGALASGWELKGITLGAQLEQVQALMPSLTCKTEAFDAGLTTCRDPNALLAEKSALLRVRLLDGKVVLVELAHLRSKQTRTSAEVLAKKYGPASRIVQVTHRPAFGDHIVRDQKHVWEDGDVQLIVNPLQPKADGGFPEGAVVLLDVAQFDGEWLRRFQAKDQSREAADAAGL